MQGARVLMEYLLERYNQSFFDSLIVIPSKIK